MTQQADIILIGGGPGGYVAAIRAAQLGFKVVCVEKRATLGGTCLNEGCIPSKALLHSSHLYEEASHGFASHGILTQGVKLDLGQMLGRKDKVVGELTKGIDFLFKKNKIHRVIGTASLKSGKVVEVQTQAGLETWEASRAVILATGSVPITLPGVTVDEQQIVSSTGALSLEKVPGKMVVIGGGYIGLELGSVWRRLGTDVTVVEFLDRLVPAMDAELGLALHKSLEKQGMQFKLGTRVEGAISGKSGVQLKLVSGDGKEETLQTDCVLLSVGRKPYTEGLGLEALGVTLDARGVVQVNPKTFETHCPGLYAIGDVIPGPMLAHKAEEEGVALVEMLAGQAGHVNYHAIPSVVYTHPEAASVGLTEEALKQAGTGYRVGKFPFMANSRAKASGLAEGWVKMLADATTDQLLGVHVIGPDAGTLIAEAVMAIEFGASAEDLARTCHAHPTLSEAMKEAALSVDARAIHV
jgi:dihydrolipoamide dehydrogenase